MNTLTKSFFESFGLRAFGGWCRPARPGMENGMFAYDESTAELFDVEEDYADVAYVEAEQIGEVADVPGAPGERIPIRMRLAGNEVFVERRPQGDYIVRRPGSERASVVTPTQAEAIDRARTIAPSAAVHVERVRDTERGGSDKWRKP
jgi:hypothetical protein